VILKQKLTSVYKRVHGYIQQTGRIYKHNEIMEYTGTHSIKMKFGAFGIYVALGPGGQNAN